MSPKTGKYAEIYPWGNQETVYEMETSRLLHLLTLLEDVPKNNSFVYKWYQSFKEELAAREGETHQNIENFTIEQLHQQRATRRLLLGLPPMLPRHPDQSPKPLPPLRHVPLLFD